MREEEDDEDAADGRSGGGGGSAAARRGSRSEGRLHFVARIREQPPTQLVDNLTKVNNSFQKRQSEK